MTIPFHAVSLFTEFNSLPREYWDAA